MLPTLAITPGEAAGIGPELCVKLVQQSWPARLLFIADPNLLQQIARQLNLPLKITIWEAGSEIPQHQAGNLNCLAIDLVESAVPGILNQSNSKYVLETLQKASDLCLDNTVQGIVTGPVHKAVINDAGYAFSGHTEYFAKAAAVKRVVMLLATEGMRVALVTTHLPLSKVSASITSEYFEKTIRIIHQDLISKFQIKNPDILVLGLNPHAGEGGHMGDEEINILSPVIKQLQEYGMNIRGPVSADTAFGSELNPTKTDVIVAMYHDQGLPVLKYRGFGSAINITLGLPYIRTSVDHGTALDIAGKNTANVSSFEYALNQAIEMATL